MENAAKKTFPFGEAEWELCYNALITEADEFFKLLQNRIKSFTMGINRMILLEQAYQWYCEDWPKKLLFNAVSGLLRDYGKTWTTIQINNFIDAKNNSWKLIYEQEVLNQSDPYNFLLSIINDDVIKVI